MLMELTMLFPFLVILGTYLVKCDGTQNKEAMFEEYFGSDDVKEIKNALDKYRKPLENAMASALLQNSGLGTINVYIKHEKNKMNCGNIYLNLGKVHLIMSDLTLKELPHFLNLDVFVLFENNMLAVNGKLSRIIVQGNYQIFRNRSDIVYAVDQSYPEGVSPFLYEEVQPMGQIVVNFEDCHIDHYMTAILVGQTVHFEHYPWKLQNCSYTVELYQPGSGSPPVIVRGNPFKDSVGQGMEMYSIDHIVAQPIFEEFYMKIQAVGFNSKIISHHMQEIRNKLDGLISETHRQIGSLIRNGRNEIDDVLKLDDYSLAWNDSPVETLGTLYKVTLSDMMLTGLDTMYLTNDGGPFKYDKIFYRIDLRFNNLQVHGKLIFEKLDGSENTKSPGIEFAASFKDVEAYITMSLNNQMNQYSLQIGCLKKTDFSVPYIVFDSMEPLINGYLERQIFIEIQLLMKSKLWAILSPLLVNDGNKKPAFNISNMSSHKASGSSSEAGKVVHPGQKALFSSLLTGEHKINNNEGDTTDD